MTADADTFVRDDGTQQWLCWDVRPWHDARGEVGGILISTEDVTARVKAEQQLRESHRQLRDLAAGLERAREAERKRIARELHDELAQALTGVKIDLAWLRERLPNGELRERASALSAIVDDTVSLGRRIASELRPGVLDDLGLAAALHWQAREFQRRTGITVRADVPDELPVDDERSTALFRIAQEALTNVVRHSEATLVRFRAGVERDQVFLEVQDNGRGMPTKPQSGSGSLGLLGMRERAVAWGGTLDVRNAADGGTLLRASIPIVQNSSEQK